MPAHFKGRSSKLQDSWQHSIQISNLYFKRDSRDIFHDLSLDIPKGKITAIMGPSGTGKTTLLHLIGGLLNFHEGEIKVFGKTLNGLRRRELFKLRENMGMLFQSSALFTDMSVFDNVAFPLREHSKLNAKIIRDIVLMKLEAVGLRGAYNLMPGQLSGGMARRVALARAIALDPEIMLYDEPFTGQDPISMGVIIKLISLLNKALGLTSVVVTHDVTEVLEIADYVHIISGGTVIASDVPEKIKQHSDVRVRQFINGEPDGPVAFHYPAREITKDFL